jgi:hypothetical protein
VKEVWKPILTDDIQERYAVSNLGRIIDLKQNKCLNINDNGAGYKIVALMGPKSKLRVRYVHRLVAQAFIENPDNLPQVGHKDHTRSNNVVDNLYWTTQKQNTADGIAAGRINANRPKKNRRVTEDLICQIALLEHQGFGVNEIAVKLDFPRTTISSVFNGRSNWELFEFVRSELKNNLKTASQPFVMVL